MTTRRWTALAFLIGWCLVSPALAQVNPIPSGRPKPSRDAPTPKTRVEIIELRRTSNLDYQVHVNTSAEKNEQQLLIFVQDHKSKRFVLTFDTIGKSQPPGVPYVSGSDPSSLEWTSAFSSPFGHPSITVFAIACELSDRARWDRNKEFDSLRYLPFGEVTTIKQVLQILADFQWRPVGFTFLDAPL